MSAKPTQLPFAHSPGSSFLTVTALTRQIETLLERGLPARVVVLGQLSNVKPHGNGHLYFTLKDEQSAISGVMWRSDFARVRFKPTDGMEVLATGKVGVYGPQGRYQLYAERLEPRGVGALELAFRQRCDKLRAEGLFDPARKRPLPLLPRCVGLVTSPSGAAVRDMVRALHRRNPAVRILLWPVPVQGEGAAEAIAGAIAGFNRLPKSQEREEHIQDQYVAGGDRQDACPTGRPDVLIVGRGGGSLEDLWAFNEEPVARAVAASEIPVISAVGHETDTTICCLVADVRAATPTAGAELAAPRRDELLDALGGWSLRLRREITRRLDLARQDVRRLEAMAFLRRPLDLLNVPRQRLDGLVLELNRVLTARLQPVHRQVNRLAERLARLSPKARLAQSGGRLAALEGRLNRAVALRKERATAQMNALEQRLGAIDPRSVLARGYSITRRARDGEVLLNPDQVVAGEAILSEIAGGTVRSTVGEGKEMVAPAPIIGPVSRRRRVRRDLPGQIRMFE